MKLPQFLATFLVAICTLPIAVIAGGNNNDDAYGLFYFQDSNDFSESNIMPKACITTNDGEAVVFDIYQANNNQCKRRSYGTYQVPIETWVIAYARDQRQAAEANENANVYEVEDEVLEFLQCSQYYYNNNMFYLKLGCRENTGKGFQLNAYSDNTCTTKVSMQYNLGIDISSLRINFGTCKSCVYTSRYNQYGNNNNNNNGGNAYYGNNGNNNGGQYYGGYSTPLCSAAYYYKQSCNRSCRRAAKKAGSGSSSSGGGGWSGDGFSPMGKFFLWAMSFSAIFFLLAALAQRKKMSKTDAVLEEAAIKSAGVDKKYIPRIIVGVAIFIIFLILFKRKILTWFFLVAVNVALLGYWMHLRNKAEEKAAVSGFQLYGGDGGQPA